MLPTTPGKGDKHVGFFPSCFVFSLNPPNANPPNPPNLPNPPNPPKPPTLPTALAKRETGSGAGARGAVDGPAAGARPRAAESRHGGKSDAGLGLALHEGANLVRPACDFAFSGHLGQEAAALRGNQRGENNFFSFCFCFSFGGSGSVGFLLLSL